MPAIGDQVATLENDHTAALALIDSLKADKAALETQLADMGKHVDDVKAMVENVASGALKMLQTVQVTARAIPGEVLTKVEAFAVGAETEATKVVTLATDHPDVTAAGMTEAQQMIDQALTAHQFAPTPAVPAPPIAPTQEPTPVFDSLHAEANRRAAFEQKMSDGVKAVVTDVEKIPAAVDRMLHHSSAASTLIRRPIDMTMHVEHDDEGLPIFLRRDTVFQREGRPQT